MKTTNSQAVAMLFKTACAGRLLPLVLLALPSVAQAQFTFITNNSAITITGYTGSGGAVSIPSLISGLPVTAIGNYAFQSSSLTSVTIPGTVTSIGSRAFGYCAGLTSVTLPSSVANIEYDAFESCDRLHAILVEALNASYSSVDGVLFNKSQTTLLICPGGKTGSYTVPNSVTSIGDSAFYDCSRLTSLTIPNNVTSVGDIAFEYCTSLTGVTLGRSVTNIGSHAFGYCENLTVITVETLNSSYTSANGVLFDKNKTRLIKYPAARPGNNYIIPNGVVTIEAEAFEHCTSLTSVAIPTGVTIIGDWTFGSCSGLTGLTLPSSVASIGAEAFEGCTGLTSVTIPSSVTNIGGWWFSAFSGCTSLNSIGVESLNSFYSSLDGVLFDKNQTTLIKCPEGKAGSFTVHSGVTNIADSAFENCTSLVLITVDTNSPAYSSLGGVLFDKSQTTLLKCPGGKTGSYTVPNTVTSIGDGAFDYGTRLTSVTIPSSVGSIGKWALYGCTSLTAIMVDTNSPAYSSLGGVLFDKSQTTLIQCPGGKAGSYTIPNSVASIGNAAFAECVYLTTLTIPNSVTNFGYWAFEGCTNLTSVTIGNGFTSIGDYAFDGCYGLTGIYFEANAPRIRYPLFYHHDSYATVYYLPGATGWGSTFGGLSTALWKPQMAADANFGVRTNRFGFDVAWASGRTVVVDACTDLANPVWSPVGTNTLNGGSSYFSDPDWANHPTRLYRLRSP